MSDIPPNVRRRVRRKVKVCEIVQDILECLLAFLFFLVDTEPFI